MLSRRRFLQSAVAMIGLPWRAAAQSQSAGEVMKSPDLALILMADLHSGYAYSAQLLHAVREAVRECEGRCPVHILINGDIFEGGNVLATRNDGLIDFTLLEELARLAPVHVTVGNHDSDLFDPAEYVARVTRHGGKIFTNIVDPRTGQGYGPPVVQFEAAGGRVVKAAAFGTPSLFTYPEKYRAFYQVPQPAEYAQAELPKLMAGADLHVALVHARFQDDRAVLPCAGLPGIVYGGHEHLRFTHREPNRLHLQSGAWSTAFALVTVRFGARPGEAEMDVRDVILDRRGPADAGMQSLIEHQRAARLHPEDIHSLGLLPKALDLDHAVLFAAAAVRDAAGADIAFLGHTTFGDGLPAGPVTPVDLSAFVRFDGGMAAATVDGALLRDVILPRTNQFGDFPYERRIGDYLYASALDPKPGRQYKLVVNSFVASAPQLTQAYFGTADMQFTQMPEVKLKASVINALHAPK